MSDDHSSSNSQSRSWIDRLSQAFSAEPQHREELLDIVRSAEAREIIDPDSLSLIEGAMQVTDMQVREIMVPRAQMVTIRTSQAPGEYMEQILDSAHSRYPVIGESQDEVIGILLAKDLLTPAFKNELNRHKIQDILRPAWFVPGSKRLNQLLKEFKENRNHMAIVVDEYGGIDGLVTIEDVLEQIVGEIEDEHDFDEEGIKCTGNNQYIVKAITTIEDFNEYFSSELNKEDFDTIGGLVIKQFGRLPKRGETIAMKGFNITILNADSRHIRLIQVSRES